MNLPLNLFDGNVNVRAFLCQPDKTIIGEVLPYEFNATFKFNTYSEISFNIDRHYNDLIAGETKVNPYYDLVESLRVIYLQGIGHFSIQDVDENISDNESKSVTCFSLEYTTGQKYLENFYVNTGEEGSIETMYHTQQYGAEYSIDNYYREVTMGDSFDPYERYYIKEYIKENSGTNAYNYVDAQIFDENHFNNYDETLYVKKYPNVRFYWPTKKELSLLHHIFDRIPEWKIGHVDKELWYQERTFSEDRVAVYDFLYNQAAETLKYVMVWDSINGVVNFYQTTEDGITADNEVETQWNTDVFISKENLASAIDIKYSADDIKTKLKITGSDTLDIRDVNLGQNYILDLSYYIPDNTPSEWVGWKLQDRYNQYVKELTTYTEQYKELISAWSAAYNEYNDLMNYVPVEPRVMLVGDEFEKLYCTYTKYRRTVEYNANATYYIYDKGKYIEVDQAPSQEEVENNENYFYIENIDAQVVNLQTKLDTYRVDQEDDKTRSAIAKTDDVLLTLENSNMDSVTIRVRYSTTNTDDKPNKDKYCIHRTFTSASEGTSNTIEFSLTDWVAGNLTAEKFGLEEDSIAQPFKIKSIGTLGAYFCLVRDETNPAELEDYGIRLLEEKKDTYTKIFITQTEGYINKEGSQCITSNELPKGNEYPDGTKWLDTDTVDDDGKLIMKIRSNGAWVDYTPDDNDYENYARFNENYTKLSNVQTVLAKKQLIADYLLNGVAVTSLHLANKDIDENTLLNAARYHFLNDTITLTEYNAQFGFVIFTVASDPNNKYAVYVSNGTPYVSYAHSQGLCLAKMNKISQITDMNTFFTKEEIIALSPYIREEEYSDDNFLLTGYESEEEQMNIKQELLKAGDEELKKLRQPKLSFSATMANILSIPEFAPLKHQFRLGNFIRVGIRDGYVKRARLLEVQISFDNPSDFSCVFGDLISTKSEIDKHADLLQQAVTAGKSVAANQGSWQRAVDKSTELDNAINDGLQDATLQIGRSSGQSIELGPYGLRGRKLIDGTTDQYEDEQVALINNKLVFTSDNWRTSKSCFGKFTIKDENGVETTHWGVLSDAVVSGYIEGSVIKGGSLEIGGKDGDKGKFVVHSDGSVEILASDAKTPVYATKSDVDLIKYATTYHVELLYDGNTVFNTDGQTLTVSCKVYKDKEEGKDDITEALQNIGAVFAWYLNGDLHKETSETKIEITNNNFTGSTQLNCQVTFDETKL